MCLLLEYACCLVTLLDYDNLLFQWFLCVDEVSCAILEIIKRALNLRVMVIMYFSIKHFCCC